MRSWLTRPGLIVLVLITAVAAVTAGSRAATRHEGSYTYGTATRQGIDAYWYDTATPVPALVIFHGGYFTTGSRTDWASTARYFADHGFAVFSADYRYDTDVAWPAPRDDAIAAVDWVKAHAADFDADPAHVAVLGSQAGGLLATTLATYGAGRSRVDAAVGLSPINSPHRAWTQAPITSATATRRKIRDETVILHRCYPSKTDTTCWKRWTDAVVKNHASSGDAPMYLLHSHGDFVPSTHSADLCTAVKAKNVSCTLTVVDGTGHASAILKQAASTPRSSPGSKPTTERQMSVSGRGMLFSARQPIT